MASRNAPCAENNFAPPREKKWLNPPLLFEF